MRQPRPSHGVASFMSEGRCPLSSSIGLAVITLGFLLISGGGSDNPAVFDASIFDFRRIHLAPALVLLGFAIEIYAILLNPTKKETQKEENK